LREVSLEFLKITSVCYDYSIVLNEERMKNIGKTGSRKRMRERAIAPTKTSPWEGGANKL
jgi:hypothetical protein